ncbi:hypothetical protein KYK30_20525 [Shinella yambaruensis]|uniref:Uncharacterized protein n=1 Tax=Shinella yambaruensis TaxID=415996 RepID=A0ABQ5ZKM3_9HYPH|nr:hypothetical protein [Shinella yambaruensis]MCJ8027019.1 hypothetical protein [Shinella yambaruensis]MCU7982089.1 hypothetical protein [Shinella yambaruensis]GLR51264.1 hypothetical protein GCM10007923_24720 [Shinella yambaruensis]
MRAVLAAIIACGCVSLVEAGETPWKPAADYLALPSDCTGEKDAPLCEGLKQEWKRDYDAATAGDYQGQRNVAYCLSTGCKSPFGNTVRTNPILGCAWRVVIVNSGHLDADADDANEMSIYCGPQFLDDIGRTMADAQARTLFKNLGIQVRLP